MRWYVYDGLGSVVDEVDPSGNLTTTGKYDVYGAKRAGGTGTATSRQGFVGSLGHITDTETGLVYMQARYYDPQTGRFVSEDPSKNGMNWFVYCENNPINEVDPDGKEPQLELADMLMIGAALLSAAGLFFATEGPKGYAASLNCSSGAAVLFGLAFTAIDERQAGALAAGIVLGIQPFMGIIGSITVYAGRALEEPGGAYAAVAIVACMVEGIMLCGAMASIDVDA